MAFDIAGATVFDQMNRGAFFHLTDGAGNPLYDSDKNAVGVTLRGRNSHEGIEASRAVGNKRLQEARQPGGAKMTVEGNERMNAEILAACTVSWTFTELDGQPFPCNLANALKFWSDDRFRRWRDLADEFISAEGNFTKG